MTELSTEPVAAQAAQSAPPPQPPNPPRTTEVEHTPGGWPVVPLALTGANSTVGMVAAASLAGGPIAAVVAATGAVVLGTVAATRSRKPSARRTSRRAAARTARRNSARAAGLRSSRSGAGILAGRSGSLSGQHRRGTTVTGGKAGREPSRNATGSTSRPAAGRLGQIKALRSAQHEAAGTRAGQRMQTVEARRAVADARRSPKAAAGQHRLSKGHAGRGLVGGAARKARAAQTAAIAKSRARRDAKTAGQVAAKRSEVRKAPARKAARQALRRSAARAHGRRLLAALLALPVGVLGLLTSPLGRKLGLPWLVHPGRRLFKRLTATAREQRAVRDKAIRDELSEKEAAADAQAEAEAADAIADSVQRPKSPTSTASEVSEGEHVSGFRFEEAAAEMEQAANAYDPDDAMEILAMVEGLPAALTSVANVMKILAERSDSEFPLEKEVADGFNDMFGALMSAVAVAEDMGPLFRDVHAQDIARHEDPRNGTEAEKGWNV
ncbi:hypothetical protein SAMN05216223_107260 [Actinacidiphila yanglinensis]|uniref:Uncharacterized protein n=1 Tax=Actinacidiphila yanglinensis TaxID=310779 RepID=A0A1H6BUV5_9ACTN|nr:hypothetical protein [Actinacidiphila yanglinensis]SEG64443.1 hypothetical protein SAMN05216223_107260 [Actinacidiphila yanglinensis]